MKVISGAFQGYASCEYDIKDFRIFLDQLCELYAFQRDRVVLSEICYGSNVTLSMDRTGHVKVEGLIFDMVLYGFPASASSLWKLKYSIATRFSPYLSSAGGYSDCFINASFAHQTISLITFSATPAIRCDRRCKKCDFQ